MKLSLELNLTSKAVILADPTPIDPDIDPSEVGVLDFSDENNSGLVALLEDV